MTKDHMFTTHTQEEYVDFTLKTSGIDPLTFYGRLLDIGCGINANLVRYLRRRGINADGIDPLVRGTEPYLMRGYSSSIPKPDNHYDLVNSSYVVSATCGLKLFHELHKREKKKPVPLHAYKKEREAFITTLREVVRVLKPEGRFVIFPEPGRFIEDEANRVESLGVSISRQEVTADRSPIDLFEECSHRLILTKR